VPVVRILAVADKRDERLTATRLRSIGADLIVSCGNLDSRYLEFIMDTADRPLFYVPGGDDPDLFPTLDPIAVIGMSQVPTARLPDYGQSRGPAPAPTGGLNIDGRVVEHRGLRIAGMGGSIGQRPNTANRYTEAQMRGRVRRLLRRARRPVFRPERPVHLLVTHSPPRDVGDLPDGAHRGFDAFHTLVARLRPRLMVHGLIPPDEAEIPDRHLEDTLIANVAPSRILEIGL
jgi:hypothetical protein